MRLTFTLFLLCALVGTSFAQINEESPFPVDFIVTSPEAAAGTYDYGTMVANVDNPIWGPIVSQDVTGELVWAYNQVDSLGCQELDPDGNIIGGPILNDVMGKIALIRRGACAFSQKVRSAQEAGAIACVIVNHYADPAQDGASLVGMLGTPPADDIVIPGVFIGRTSGEIIAGQLDAGETVMVNFSVKSFYDPVGSFSYHTPLDQAQAVNAFRVNYVNPSETDAVDVAVNATITSPSGLETVLSGTSNVAALADSIILMDGEFTPDEMGEYTVAYTNDQSDETVETKFVMTDYTFAVDNGALDGSAGPADADFASTHNFRYNAGSLVLPGPDGGVATHASFGLTNAALLASGDPDADQIIVVLYDADNDMNNQVDDITTDFTDLAAIALATYTITGNEEPGEMLYVELENILGNEDDPIELRAGGAYFITITYDGTNAGTGVAPRYVATEDVAYLNFPTTPIILDQVYTGWNDRTVALRLHLAGFEDPTSVRDLPALDASKVTVAPNPVQSLLNVQFELEEVASEVSIVVVDVNGKTLGTYNYENVLNKTVQIDVDRLPAGTYFLSIMTPEGFRAERIIKQ